jgi:hypothetical protein
MNNSTFVGKRFVMAKLSFALSVIACLFCGLILWNNNQEKQENKAEQTQSESTHEEHVHIIDYMVQMQYFANKIYYAGIHGNWDLLGFYIHEMEEVMEDLEAYDLQKDGVGVSKNLKLFGIEPLELFEQNSKNNPEQFAAHYDAWINQCNACHAVFKKPFIQIIRPSAPVVSNQRFEP